MDRFLAYVMDSERSDGLQERLMSAADLMPGEVTVKVEYSSVNYKDALAVLPHSRIMKTSPCIPGIDLAGVVAASSDPRFREGDGVIGTGYGIGVSHYGGYSRFARLPADWLVPLPEGLSLREAMIFGTAGLTAALSIRRLTDNGLTPERGPVLVTGATGGVGSLAVAMLAKLGFHVAASTGKAEEHGYLRELGAAEILSREEIIGAAESEKPLGRRRWAAAIDPVGGRTLSGILRALEYGGSAASSGLAGGHELQTTVYPFILRGVNLLGIDSVECPLSVRETLWRKMGAEWKPPQRLLELIAKEIPFTELPAALDRLTAGAVRGRQIVSMERADAI